KYMFIKKANISGVTMGDLIPGPAWGSYFDNTWWEPAYDISWDGSKWVTQGGELWPITSGPNAGWQVDFRPSTIRYTYTPFGYTRMVWIVYQLTNVTAMFYSNDESPNEEVLDWSIDTDLEKIYLGGDSKAGWTSSNITNIEFLI
ncbi:unnamed protein product, partial [marine sediment metagenome]